ncbi:hypothetical protein LEAN103870_09495 [Legionella anisa]|uniref:Uncharacterized protein n=1 Tax=Legionella anisa TaxID=28082 RepID=A0AAX0WZI0_9GAMM|nr:hypothetical protein [Legionella anisa]AWN73299.1 hypothetical protein DLD14_05270 [Legionella anisa]KTC69888.1 hypothetical protein Lani_2594 [Legionella anisa]MBN5936666.1 hypothetical protein [Legionella anisa]MCW8423037.1 hypothetical protein [Legionella anisa]MCW8447820.1 hypothetical protein [Legionella anisa]
MYQKLQTEGRVGRKGFFSKEEKKPVENNTIHIKVKNTQLSIDKGHFEGSLGAAEEAIQFFADQNEITYKSLGHGYGILTVQGMNHHITPYGIDISMMLEFCNIDESKLTQQLEI